MCVDTFTNISNAIFHSARPIHVWWVFDLMVDAFRWKAWINVICIACIHIRNTYNLGSIDRKEFSTKLNQQMHEWKSMQRTCTHTSLSLLFDERGPQGQPPSNLFNVNSAKCFAAHNSYYFHLEFRIHITLLLASPTHSKQKLLPQQFFLLLLFAFCFWRWRIHMKFHSWNLSHPFLFKNNYRTQNGIIYLFTMHHEKHCASMSVQKLQADFRIYSASKCGCFAFICKQNSENTANLVCNTDFISIHHILWMKWNEKRFFFDRSRMLSELECLKCVVMNFRFTFRFVDKIWSNHLI